MIVSCYEAGDLITGVDRSYMRSIYRLGSLIPSSTGLIETYFIAYNGEVCEYPARQSLRAMTIKELTDEFRMATASEIEKAAFPMSIQFIEATLDAGLMQLSHNERAIFDEIKAMRVEVKLDFETGTIDWEPELERRKKAYEEIDKLPYETVLKRIQCNGNHEPIEYTSFNMVYKICKKCDKTLA